MYFKSEVKFNKVRTEIKLHKIISLNSSFFQKCVEMICTPSRVSQDKRDYLHLDHLLSTG